MRKTITKADHAAIKADAALYAATVLSCDPTPSACPECRERRRIYQTHVFVQDDVIGRCKGCLTERFGDHIYIRQVGGSTLRAAWRDDAPQQNATGRKLQAQENAPSPSDAQMDGCGEIAALQAA